MDDKEIWFDNPSPTLFKKEKDRCYLRQKIVSCLENLRLLFLTLSF